MSADYPGQDIFHETITVLDDNQQPSALNFALAVEGLTDRTMYLKNRGSSGAYVQASATNTPASGTVIGLTGGSGNFAVFPTANGLTPYLDVPNCQVGDIVMVWCSGPFIQQGNATKHYAEIKLYSTQDYGGSGVGPAAISGAHAFVTAIVGDGDKPQPVMMQGFRVVTVAGTCRIWLYGKNPDATGVDQSAFAVGLLDGGYPLIIGAQRFRPTADWAAE